MRASPHVFYREMADKMFWSKQYVSGLIEGFYCLPNDLLIPKPESYGFYSKIVSKIKSYLNQRKQFVNVNKTSSATLEILSGLSQGSIIGLKLLNMFFKPLLSSTYQKQ